MMRLKDRVRKAFWLLFLLLLAACSAKPVVRVSLLPSYDSLFETREGWTGADGAYTVPLSQNAILWLFGDTWWGRIRDGRHVDAAIVNNSIAVQEGLLPADAGLQFYCGRTPEGTPRAFILPADGRGWLWPFHGTLAPDGLYLFLMQMQRTSNSAAFGFQTIGVWLARVDNYREPPPQWQIVQRRLPWTAFSGGLHIFFGSWVLRTNGFFYIYGIAENRIDGQVRKNMVLARVPQSALGDFKQWRFFAGGRWIADFAAAGYLCSNMANEYSVSFLAGWGKYVAVYSQDGLACHIMVRWAPEPWGPWSPAAAFYRCPEADEGRDIICYAAKGHPELSRADDALVVTYVANSTDFYAMAADARLYHPRFIRLKFIPFQPDRQSSP